MAATEVIPLHEVPFLCRLPELRLAPRKRNICVFDPDRRGHYPLLRGTLKNLANIVWFDRFSRESLGQNELAVNIGIDEVNALNPPILIVELELIRPNPDWRDGIRLLENFRRSQRFNSVKDVIVLSNSRTILEAGHNNFLRLGVSFTFPWEALRRQEMREDFVDIVCKAL